MTPVEASAPPPISPVEPLLQVAGVQKHFPVHRGVLRRQVGVVRAVDGVDLEVGAGQTVGLVGESGSGKSTLGRVVLHLVEPTAGRVLFKGQDLTTAPAKALRRLRRDAQMVFQDPYSSMDPRATVGDSIGEPLRAHLHLHGAVLKSRIDELLAMVGLDPSYRRRRPSEFSGGQLQRIAIARAIATRPGLLVLDEAVSALDVSTQAEVINLLADLQRDLGTAYLFITHNLAVVRHVSDRIAVMYLGRIVEEGPSEVVYSSPAHPYTRALLSAIPTPDPVVQRSRDRVVLSGEPPSPSRVPTGCRFHTRCPSVMDICRVEEPPLSRGPNGTRVYCHLYPEAVRASGAETTMLSLVGGETENALSSEKAFGQHANDAGA